MHLFITVQKNQTASHSYFSNTHQDLCTNVITHYCHERRHYCSGKQYLHRHMERWYADEKRCIDVTYGFLCMRLRLGQRSRIQTHSSKWRLTCLNHPLRLRLPFIAQILHFQSVNWCNLAQWLWTLPPPHTQFLDFSFLFFSCFVSCLWSNIYLGVISLFLKIAHISMTILN